MDIIYYGLACDEEFLQERLKRDPSPYIVAQQAFETALLEQLQTYSDVTLNCHYIPQETSQLRFISSHMAELPSGIKIRFLSCLNLPFIKFIWLFFATFFRTLHLVLTKRQKQTILLHAVNYFPVSLANYVVCKLFHLKNICIFTDSTAFLTLEDRISQMSPLKRKIMPLYIKAVKKLEACFSGYIFFAQPMDNVINVRRSPSIVMEGIFNPQGLNLEPVPKKRAIMYGGSLFRQYGIMTFIDAFRQIDAPDLKLWIFGSGELEKEIQAISEQDPRVQYKGFCPRHELFEYEKSATLLINTRSSKDIYTRLSFPSKTFEYMVSGTPFLTTKIGGIPEEYYPYLFVTEGETPSEIKKSIESILSLSDEEREQFGLRARSFILQNKNAAKQTEKVYHFLKMI